MKIVVDFPRDDELRVARGSSQRRRMKEKSAFDASDGEKGERSPPLFVFVVR